MQAQMVSRVLTLEMATAASMLVRMAHPQNQSLHRALAKAEQRLVELPWSVDGGVLCISSHSAPGQVHFCDGDTCDCLTTRGTCWHNAGFMILSTLAATGIIIAAPLPLPRPEVYRQIEDGEYFGDFLDSLDEQAYDDYGDLIPAARATFAEPFRPRKSIEHVPAPGSDLAKAQELADRMFAA
jgi:hypothetical protein